MKKITNSVFATISLLATLNPGIAAADDLTVKIGLTAGGGYDVAGRLMARHLPNHLGRDTTSVVQNVPGASSLNLARQMNVDDDDEVLGMVLSSLILDARLNPEKAAIDFSTFQWIGSINSAVSICLVSKASGAVSVDDFARSGLRIGATSKQGGFYKFAALLKNVLDADYEIITGFKGLTDIEAAIDRGELDGYCGSQFDRFIRNQQGETRQLIGSLTVPLEQDGATLPAIVDFISDEKDTAVASIFATARDAIYYPVMMSPGVSPEAVDRHRQAFDAMVKDEAFLDEAADIYLSVSPMSGEEVEAAVAAISALDPDDVALLNQYLQ